MLPFREELVASCVAGLAWNRVGGTLQDALFAPRLLTGEGVGGGASPSC